MAALLAGAVGAAWLLKRRGDDDAGGPNPLRISLEKGTGEGEWGSRAAVIPAEFLPFTPLAVHGPGDVTLSNSLLDAFAKWYPERNPTTAFVSRRGSDTGGKLGDPARPFATIQAALEVADTVELEDGDYPPFVLKRGTKLVRARNPGKVRIAVPAGVPHRVVDSSRMDRDGFPVRLPLSQAGQPGTRSIYWDERRSAQVLVSGGALCLHGIDFHGVMCKAEGGQLWASRFISFASPFFAFVAIGGEIFLETGRIHAARWDGWNCDWTNNRGTIAAAGVETTESGDFSVFGRGDAFNRQAGSSHSGYLAAFACIGRHSMGQEYADTSAPGVPNRSWYVGCIVGDDAHAAIDGGLGFSFAGNGHGGREAFLDTCRSEGLAVPLFVEAGAVAFTHECNFEGATYDPEDPETALANAERKRMMENEF